MLPLHEKIAYGIGRFGSSFFLSLTGFTLFLIYGMVFELNWILNGIATSIGLLFATVGSMLAGYGSDRNRSF